jgi:protein-S-isoprenylcysteine O-methyltransferase Ste14
MANKILPPTYLTAAIVLILLLHFLLPVRMVLELPLNLIGLVPLILGTLLNLIADHVFKLKQTTVKPFQKSSTLITDGVYRLSRHPMYLGFLLILIGMSMLLGSLTPYIVVIVFGILMDVIFIRVEERMLEERFGQEWKEYNSRVRLWI